MVATVTLSMLTLSLVFKGEDASIVILSIVYGLCIVILIAVEALRPHSSAVASGLVPTLVSPKIFAMGMAWATFAVLVVALAALILGGTFSRQIININATAISSLILFAIGEEVVFRGTIFRALEERFSSVTAVIATSLPFALLHMNNPGATVMGGVNVFLAGIAIGTSVVVTRSLWMAIGFHTVWNLALALGFGKVSGYDLSLAFYRLDVTPIATSLRGLIAGPFGVEDGLVTTLILVLSVILMKKIQLFDPFVQASRLRQFNENARLL